MRRVVRLIKVVSNLASSRDRLRLTAEGVWPTCSAAAEIEPHSITHTKICNSSDLAFTCVPHGKLARQSPYSAVTLFCLKCINSNTIITWALLDSRHSSP